MDSLNNLNLTIPNMWEVRDVFNKVKSVVLNYTEMEAKVHDATNNEAWGASSTAMQEIAQATHNYEYFNEIMPTIYKRFTDKEARYWRQIYKSLVLLEYLVKNGSERVVDDARSHISMIKMMKNFHYVDDKGKDQGINVRNRAKELAELLSNVDMIKAERKKAKKNRNKYTGVGNEGGMSFGASTSRYEGYGSSSNGNNRGYGGNSDFYDDERPGRYDESKRSPSPEPAQRRQPKTAKDLFDFEDGPVTSKPKKQQQQDDDDDFGDFANGDGNDDFDDFQSAPVASTASTTTQPKKNDILDLLGEDSFVSTPVVQQQQQPPINFNTQQQQQQIPTASFENLSISQTSTPSDTAMKGIWSSGSNLFSLDSLGSNKPAPTKTAQGPSMNTLKSSSVNNDWNNWASTNTTSKPPQNKQSSVFDDLLSL